jgi:ubiquinone/menaquinone biosynthesis C-methylase UbiE
VKPAIRVFDHGAEDYDHWFDTHNEIYENQLLLLRHHVPLKGTGLEIGVGSGRFAVPLGIRYGLDPSPALLSMARQRGTEAVLGIGESLPYRDNTFDFVLVMTVTCFMEDLDRPFREVYRVLKLRGLLVIGFLEQDGEIARREQERITPGRFLQYATFRATSDVMSALDAAGFSGSSYKENLHGFCIVTAQKG